MSTIRGGREESLASTSTSDEKIGNDVELEELHAGIVNTTESTVEEQICPDHVTSGSGDIKLFYIEAVSSSSSSLDNVCRICQLENKESGEPLQSTECDCRGNLSRVHPSCLKEWVRYKGSTRCEICRGHFGSITPPVYPGILQIEAFHQLAWHLDQQRPFTRRKRAMMGAMVIFLSIVTSLTAVLTVSADQKYETLRQSRNPWTSQKNLDESNIEFSICIAVSFFCATMTIGLVLIWIGMECCFVIHRRGIMRRATRQLLQNENRA